MEKKKRLRDLFGSMSKESESPPASPPPGVWPPPIDPRRRYPAPRVGTRVQRGDGSQRAYTRWLEELPPAPPKTTRNRQNQPTGTTTTRKPPRKGTAVASKAAASGTVASAPPTATASGPGGSREQERQPFGKEATTAGRINAATRDKSTARGTTMTSIPGSSGQGQDARQTSATPLVLPLPPFAAVKLSRPPVTPPPAPAAYVINKGWTARAGVPLQVPIQLPDGEIVQVPMSAIQQNRKYRARSATGRWVLRFAADGRLTLCRKVQEPAP
ncbi:hypothetical protein PUN28_015267 [Cardiocondyla obscurior]|uniref:Uncharacterized protein n=1 Tax=Cardiocondyla obscurior TaxID=286306 RepID=A0AAW2F1X5_9HYME